MLNKYLKYKQKYINLKTQSGGGSEDDQYKIRNDIQNLLRTYCPHNVDPDKFVAQNYIKGMTYEEATKIVQNDPQILRDKVRFFLSMSTPSGIDRKTFVNKHYKDGMTYEEAIELINDML